MSTNLLGSLRGERTQGKQLLTRLKAAKACWSRDSHVETNDETSAWMGEPEL